MKVLKTAKNIFLKIFGKAWWFVIPLCLLSVYLIISLGFSGFLPVLIGIHDEDDSLQFESCRFTVPADWADKLVREFSPSNTLDTFLNEYTYDDTLDWIGKAKEEGVLIGAQVGYICEAEE